MPNTKIPPFDLMFFLTETAQSPKHVGAVQVFELPPDISDDYLLKLVEQFREAPVLPPFNRRPIFPRFSMPEWETDDDMEMNYHVRHSALPRPGTTTQLMEVVQSAHAGLLDRSRPCWICQVIEGLEGNRFAIYNKVHHSYIDGMSGVKRMYGALSSSSDDKKQVTPWWSYNPDKSTTVQSKKGDNSRKSPAGQLATQIKGAVQAGEFITRSALSMLTLRDRDAQVPFKATRTRTNLPIERETRSTAVCSFDLDKVKAICRKRGCTVNEVVLAVVGAALNEYLDEHHEGMRSPLIAVCPVSLRAEGDNTATTQVAAVYVRLGEVDAQIDERLTQVIASSHAAKEKTRGLSSEALIDYTLLVIGLLELVDRTHLNRIIKPSYNVLVSNVPGPDDSGLYLNGSRMVASYPISTLMQGVNLNVTLLSHGNKLDFGLLGDRHALPDLALVSQHMVEQFVDLEREVLGKKRSGRRK